jgi:IclR family KDG regulon transcriptional repressor
VRVPENGIACRYLAQGKGAVQSLERALRILDAFGGRQLGVTEVAREHRLTKSTAFRLLSTLRQAGYLQQDGENGRYRLGLRLLQLGQTVADRLDLRRVSLPTMAALAERGRGASYLAVLFDGSLINVAQIESPDPVRLVIDDARLSRLPHTVGTGKVLMAHLPIDQRERLVDGLEMVPLTPHTIVARDDLRREIDRVRLQGYAVNDQEQVIGVRGVAAPIRDREGRVIAAVSIAAPSARLTREAVPTYTAWVRAAADEISTNLGAKGGEPWASTV